MTVDLSLKQRLCVFSALSVSILVFLNTRESPASNTIRVGEPSVFVDTDYAVALFMLIPFALGWVGIAAKTRAGVMACFVLSALIMLCFWVYYEHAKTAGIFCLTGEC